MHAWVLKGNGQLVFVSHAYLKCCMLIIIFKYKYGKVCTLYANYISACRGVILYAMVCGRLPFGDDNQIKKTQSRVLYFNRNVSSGESYVHSFSAIILVTCVLLYAGHACMGLMISAMGDSIIQLRMHLIRAFP